MNATAEHSGTAWRWKSRPMMVAILTSLTLFFFSATFYQLSELIARSVARPRRQRPWWRTRRALTVPSALDA